MNKMIKKLGLVIEYGCIILGTLLLISSLLLPVILALNDLIDLKNILFWFVACVCMVVVGMLLIKVGVEYEIY